MYYNDISYPKQRYQMLQVREDKIHTEIEIAATKLGL
jgi:hypothetical protein